ncbi:MAG: M48 family metallopeptidase, partial [Ignavibacteriaceae bacterium]|nr:M48 family metallopeptidase [Ignavibacteriaceae bacterium]
IWGILSLISYFSGSKILLAVSGAKEVTKEVHPQLFNVVEEMKISAGLPTMPKVYIINEIAPNAFATGIKPENSAVAVTAGLLARLNRDELQGVVAHEVSHIVNRDVLFMTFAGIMLGSIVLISEVFLRSLWFGGGRYSSKSSKSSGQGQMIIMIVAIVFAILAPILAQLLYFAISRKREYLADASAVRYTRYPEGLASALEKISDNSTELKTANKVTAPMYIVNPLKPKGQKLTDLTSTHPPISERVRILRNISGGANYIDYQNAFNKVKRVNESLIPSSGLAEQTTVGLKAATVTPVILGLEKQTKRDTGDIMMKVNNYSFIDCSCGLKIKIPPDFKKKKFFCPRCGRKHSIHS